MKANCSRISIRFFQSKQSLAGQPCKFIVKIKNSFRTLPDLSGQDCVMNVEVTQTLVRILALLYTFFVLCLCVSVCVCVRVWGGVFISILFISILLKLSDSVIICKDVVLFFTYMSDAQENS